MLEENAPSQSAVESLSSGSPFILTWPVWSSVTKRVNRLQTGDPKIPNPRMLFEILSMKPCFSTDWSRTVSAVVNLWQVYGCFFTVYVQRTKEWWCLSMWEAEGHDEPLSAATITSWNIQTFVRWQPDRCKIYWRATVQRLWLVFIKSFTLNCYGLGCAHNRVTTSEIIAGKMFDLCFLSDHRDTMCVHIHTASTEQQCKGIKCIHNLTFLQWIFFSVGICLCVWTGGDANREWKSDKLTMILWHVYLLRDLAFLLRAAICGYLCCF